MHHHRYHKIHMLQLHGRDSKRTQHRGQGMPEIQSRKRETPEPYTREQVQVLPDIQPRFMETTKRNRLTQRAAPTRTTTKHKSEQTACRYAIPAKLHGRLARD